MQKIEPKDYAAAALSLPDVWIEDVLQKHAEVPWLIGATKDCHTVLELGWGSGIVARALKDAGRVVRVVDGAEQFCNDAQAAGIEATHAMFEDFSMLGQESDCTVASFILEHVADPMTLLKRARAWAPRLIVVVANAESWHRRLAVKMGLQPQLGTLSPRDHAVGHYRVYTPREIEVDLGIAGWAIRERKGLVFKPLPNAITQTLDWKLVQAMAEIEVDYADAGVLGLVCERL